MKTAMLVPLFAIVGCGGTTVGTSANSIQDAQCALLTTQSGCAADQACTWSTERSSCGAQAASAPTGSEPTPAPGSEPTPPPVVECGTLDQAHCSGQCTWVATGEHPGCVAGAR